jgi:hypothetical protein
MTSPSVGRPVARCADRDHCGPKAKHLAARLLCAALALALSAAVVAGCSSSGSSPQLGDPTSSTPAATTSAPSPTVSSSSPATGSVRSQILGQYDAFWKALPGASRASASHRRALLAKYSANPELTSLLAGMARQDREGKVIYGFDRPHAVVRTLAASQGVAVISDCQDSSHSGVARRSSGRHLTVGVKHNHVVSTMHLGRDDVWRVSFVAYPTTPC